MVSRSHTISFAPNLLDSNRIDFIVNPTQLSRLRYARLWMTFLLAATDLVSISLAFGLSLALTSRLHWGRALFISEQANWIPALLFIILYYAVSGLYPTVGMSPVDELRLISRATMVAFALFFVYSFWSPASIGFPRTYLLLAFPLTLLLTQFNRWALRIIAGRIGFWGEPVILVGIGPETQYVLAYLKDSLRLGLRPVATIDGYASPHDDIWRYLKKAGIHTAIMVVSEVSDEMNSWMINQQSCPFYRLILIPSLDWVYSLGVTTYDLEGLLGLGVRQNLLNPWHHHLKRVLDLLLVFLAAIPALPVSLLFALMIRLDSPGKALYSQVRVGLHGKSFKIWKFRTMIPDADRNLDDILASNPNLQAEWQATRKFKHDMRITRVGKFLRAFSLDELPQLWNVLLGQMSMVGPRPIVTDEIEHYQQVFNLYKQVRPGLTGLWQVSGRSNNSYPKRVRYDQFYIRNWSLWLDIYILLRTPWVVFSRRGAY